MQWLVPSALSAEMPALEPFGRVIGAQPALVVIAEAVASNEYSLSAGLVAL
jgi:hypothetical protein